MRFVIDRFEGKFAVCETENGVCFDLPRGFLPDTGEGVPVRIIPGGDIRILSSDGKSCILAAEGIRAAVPAFVMEGFSVGDFIGFERDDEVCEKRSQTINKLMDELFED